MKKSKFSDEQIAYALRLSEPRTPVADVCRQLCISEATFHVWTKKYAELGVTELRQLRQLTEENALLKRIVADLTLNKQILQEVIKEMYGPGPRCSGGSAHTNVFGLLQVCCCCSQAVMRFVIRMGRSTSKALDEWAWRHGVQLDFIRPASPSRMG